MLSINTRAAPWAAGSEGKASVHDHHRTLSARWRGHAARTVIAGVIAVSPAPATAGAQTPIEDPTPGGGPHPVFVRRSRDDGGGGDRHGP